MREKPVPVMVVELLEMATRLPKAADPPSPQLRRGSWRPPLLVVQPERATLQQDLFVPRAWRSDRLARASFAPSRQL